MNNFVIFTFFVVHIIAFGNSVLAQTALPNTNFCNNKFAYGAAIASG